MEFNLKTAEGAVIVGAGLAVAIAVYGQISKVTDKIGINQDLAARKSATYQVTYVKTDKNGKKTTVVHPLNLISVANSLNSIFHPTFRSNVLFWALGPDPFSIRDSIAILKTVPVKLIPELDKYYRLQGAKQGLQYDFTTWLTKKQYDTVSQYFNQ